MALPLIAIGIGVFGVGAGAAGCSGSHRHTKKSQTNQETTHHSDTKVKELPGGGIRVTSHSYSRTTSKSTYTSEPTPGTGTSYTREEILERAHDAGHSWVKQPPAGTAVGESGCTSYSFGRSEARLSALSQLSQQHCGTRLNTTMRTRPIGYRQLKTFTTACDSNEVSFKTFLLAQVDDVICN